MTMPTLVETLRAWFTSVGSTPPLPPKPCSRLDPAQKAMPRKVVIRLMAKMS